MGSVNPEVRELFEDAVSLYGEALRDLNAGRLRDAAEKAWCATVRATAALLIARGKAKSWDDVKYAGPRRVLLDELESEDRDVEELKMYERYCVRSDSLHGACFYEGICEPKERVTRRIRETIDYIRDTMKLAGIK